MSSLKIVRGLKIVDVLKSFTAHQLKLMVNVGPRIIALTMVYTVMCVAVVVSECVHT